ncbi:MAG: hypothetical protein IK150_04585 [Lachnospiraceae bacterium]|nr:hypothetical protein [Lachnospiraceae bacterium]
MRARRYISILLILLLIGGLTKSGAVHADNPKEIIDIHVTVDRPACGEEITEESPDPTVELAAFTEEGEAEGALELVESRWASAYRSDGYEPYTGPIQGDENYTVYLVLRTAGDFMLAEETIMTYTDGRGWCQDLFYDEKTAVLAVHVYADHVKDSDDYEREDPSCVSTGLETYTCTECHQMIVSFLPMDPEAHSFSEWTILKEATPTEKGERTRKCMLCGKEETEETPKAISKVYEPESSWSMGATVAWRSDDSAIKTAVSERRPQVGLVWVDASLNVYERNGSVISKDINAYVTATARNMIPAFCFQNEAEARALLDWLRKTGLEDCFLVSAPQNQEHIKTIIAHTHVMGILDYTLVGEADRETLSEMARTIKDANGQIVILSPECATRENLRILHEFGVSAWVKTASDLKTLMTLYLNGVDGVLTEDFEAVLDLEERFRDEAPTLLRMPRILGAEELPEDFDEHLVTAFTDYDEEAAKASRHRGAVSWTGTYELEENGDAWAKDFLTGPHGMIVDRPETIDDYLVEILSEDLTCASKDDAPKPLGRTRNGQEVPLSAAELLILEEDTEDDKMLALWRCQAELSVNGEKKGQYYVYSMPFSLTIEIPPTEAPTQATTEAPTEAPTEPEPPEKPGADAVTVLLWILFGLASIAFLGSLAMIAVKMMKRREEGGNG